MATIYELTDEYRLLLELAEDPDVDPDTLADTLEALGGEIEVKAEGYGRVMKQLEADAAALKAEEKRLARRRSACENSIARMKKALQTTMETTGKTKFKTNLFSFWIQKNAPRLVVDDEKKVTAEYFVPQDPVRNDEAIKKAMKEGAGYDWCHLEQSESLRIK